MTATLDSLPKAARALPPEAQQVWLEAYNKDFGWRSSEAHAEKAAWRAVVAKFPDAAAKAVAATAKPPKA